MPPRLSSLELHGYKTFASRTVFDFPGDITAIVGPNGSGKSNIADALRWVLGEQSYSLLRGRKTEDMIFAGSEQRPKSGMASATITFDNGDGWLPIDFTEVSITRRAYRDGQNEYLLNGHRVRLREISELLAQSGLAERTYTIIGQGLVDAALALKPEERRRLFEEAAGIGLYRSRREEAINRLETTRHNLERVQDILAELEPRLHSLEKQARKAREFQNLEADLHLALREWYGFNWQKCQGELGHAREVLKVQQGQVEHCRQRHQDLATEIGLVRELIAEQRTRLNEWHSAMARLHQELEQTGRKRAILEERKRSWIELRQNLMNDLAQAEEESDVLQTRIQSAKADQVELDLAREEAENQLEAARQALEARQAERQALEKRLTIARQSLSALETQLVRLSAQRSEIGDRIRQQEKTIQGLDQSISNTQKTLASFGVELSRLEKEKGELEGDAQKLRQLQQQYKAERANLDNRVREMTARLSREDIEKERLAVQKNLLDQAERSHSGMATGAKFLLEARSKGRLKGRYRSLISSLEVQKPYEIAVAAALGEAIDLVVIDPDPNTGWEPDPDDAFRLLEGGKGRAALLPLQWMGSAQPVRVPEDPDALGLASEFVSGAAETQAVIHLLLSQIVVARDRAAARRLVKNMPAHGRVVTLNGEIFWANGTAVTGQVTSQETSTLSRSRQVRELSEAIAVQETVISRLRQELREVEKQVAAKRDDEARLDRQAQEKTGAVEKANKTYQQALLKVEQTRRQLDWYQTQKTDQESQRKNSGNEAKQVDTSIQDTETKTIASKDQVRELIGTLGEMPLEEHQAQAAHWSTTLAVASRAIQDALHRLGELDQTYQSGKAACERIRSRLDGIHNDLIRLETEKGSTSEVDQGLNDQITLLQENIEPAETELSRQEKDYEELLVQEEAEQQTLSIAERHHTQALMEYTRQREAVDHLRNRIEEDFGLVLLEYDADVEGPTPLPLEGMVEQLPVVVTIPPDLETNISRLRGQIRRLGAVNPDALTEYESVRERFGFITGQISDLKKADVDLRDVISKLDELMKREFRKTFDLVANQFRLLFTRLFGGGSARLMLTDDDQLNEAGIDIEARLPGRREQGLSLLSGGERSLTAVALIFALLKVSPTPFCVLDEVDAMLDEANVSRFRDLLAELSENSQFIIITHNRNTIQAADVIYGVTMGRDSASQVISLRLEEVSEELVR